MMRIRAGLIVVALLVAWPPLVNAEEPAPILLEAIILDETCNPSCIGEQPSHVVEFFSADWCDPCRSVESMLRNGTHQEDQVLILTHHPSPADASFLSYSYLRQTRTYRLVGIPNLVVDGAELLSGDRQGLELDEVLDRRANITLDSEIMSDIELVDGNMTWSPVPEGVVHLLRIEDHVGPEGLVPNLITNGTSGAARNGSMAVPEGAGQLVLLYEAEGLPSLVLGSDLPLLGGLEIDDGGLGTLDDRGFPTWASATLIAASALLLWSLTRPPRLPPQSDGRIETPQV